MESNFFEITIEIGGHLLYSNVSYEETIESLFTWIRAHYSQHCKNLNEFFSKAKFYWTLSHDGINLLDNYFFYKQITIAQSKIKKGSYLSAFQTVQNDPSKSLNSDHQVINIINHKR